MALQLATPPGVIEWFLTEWIAGLRGRHGRTTKDITLVAHDEQWIKILVPVAPREIGRERLAARPLEGAEEGEGA